MPHVCIDAEEKKGRTANHVNFFLQARKQRHAMGIDLALFSSCT
jgi:hypothetical protein